MTDSDAANGSDEVWFAFWVEDDGDDIWSVTLPHQCDDWNISTPEHYDRYSYGGPGAPLPHAEMVATMEKFLAEATDALDSLRARRPVAWTVEDDQYVATWRDAVGVAPAENGLSAEDAIRRSRD